MHALRDRAGWLAVSAAVLASLALSASANAASNKPYSVVICALGTNETCAPSPTSSANWPAAIPAGTAAVSMTATFTNGNKAGSGINLGSANLTPPTGFSVSGTPTLSGCGSTCTASVVSNVVQLRGLALPPGSAATVTMTVNLASPAPTCLFPTGTTGCAWSAVVKQSNDFSGSPGNNLTFDAAHSAPNTVIAHLQFGAQPADVILGDVITDSNYIPPPAGKPVTVQTVDAHGTVVGSYNGPVSLTLTTPSNQFTNPTPATLGGTSATNAAAGVATFADLTVSDAGNGFTLTASSDTPPSTTPILPPDATSNPFDAQQAGTQCPKNKPCPQIQASADFTSNGGINASVSASSGASDDVLAESTDFGTPLTQGECEGYQAAHDVFWNTPGSNDRSKLVSITTTVLSGSISGSLIKGQDDCLAAPFPFTEVNESTNPPSLSPAPATTLPDGTAGFAGLLPDCGKKNGQVDPAFNPCVQSRTGSSNPLGGGTLTITISIPANEPGDPHSAG